MQSPITFTYTRPLLPNSKPVQFSVPPMGQTKLIPITTGLSDLASLSIIPMEYDRCERTIEPPENWDPRFEYAEYISPIMTQGSCGSCWAFATTGAMASRFAFFMNQKVKPLSPAYMVMCATPEFSTMAEPVYGCYGGSLVQAFWFFEQNGVVAQDCLDVSLRDWVPGDTSIQRRIITRTDITHRSRQTHAPDPCQCSFAYQMCPSRQTRNLRKTNNRTRNAQAQTFVSCPLNKCVNVSKPDEIPFVYKLAVAYIVGGSPGQRNTSERNIRLEMYRNGPAATGFEVRADFIDFWKGLLEGRLSGDALVYQPQPASESNPIIGNHAVQLMGWGLSPGGSSLGGSSPGGSGLSPGGSSGGVIKYWIIANSWGATNREVTDAGLADWGNNGYFLFIRGVNACYIESNVIAGLPKIDPNVVGADGVTRVDAGSLICNTVLYEINANTLKQLGMVELDTLPDPIGIYSWILPPISETQIGHIQYRDTCPPNLPIRCPVGSCAQTQVECGRKSPTLSSLIQNATNTKNAQKSVAREIEASIATDKKNENSQGNIDGLINSYNYYTMSSLSKTPVRINSNSVAINSKTNTLNAIILTIVFFESCLFLVCFIFALYTVIKLIKPMY